MVVSDSVGVTCGSGLLSVMEFVPEIPGFPAMLESPARHDYLAI